MIFTFYCVSRQHASEAVPKSPTPQPPETSRVFSEHKTAPGDVGISAWSAQRCMSHPLPNRIGGRLSVKTEKSA